MGEMLILRLLHIVGGVFWAGTLLFFALFLEPTLRAMGPDGGRVMQRIAQTRYPMVISAAAGITILSGLRLYQLDSRGGSAWFRSGFGMTLTVGAVAAIIAFLIGIIVSRPAGVRMGKLAAEMQSAGGPPSEAQLAEVTRMRSRIVASTRAVAALLAVATVSMAIARYVG